MNEAILLTVDFQIDLQRQVLQPRNQCIFPSLWQRIKRLLRHIAAIAVPAIRKFFIVRLMEHIQSEVYRVSGIELEPEVKIIRE